MSSAYLCLIINLSSFWSWSLQWAMSESSHSQLFSWVKLFSTSLDLHKVLRCSLLIFWWSFSDCLCSIWCVHHVLVSWSFYTLHALSLQFSSLMSETFLKLLELSSSSCEVQCLHFQACKATLLNFVTSSTCLQFLERSDQLISFVSLSSLFTKILRFLQNDDRSSLNCCFSVVNSSLVTSTHDDVLNVKCVFSYVCSCLLRS